MSVEAVWSACALVVNRVHWLVASVAWQFNLVVLDDVLLNDGSSVATKLRLLHSFWVEVSLGNKSIVTWNVCCGLGCSHGQLVMLISKSLCIIRQFVSWVLSIGAEGLGVLSVEVTSLGGVSLAVDAPLWSS